MRADELAAPSGSSFKFENIGDTVEGVIAYVGDWQERINKFNGKTEQVMRLGIDSGDGEPTYVWPVKGSAMAQAIAEAMRDAKVDDLLEGQKIKLRFDSEKDTGKPQKLKLFKARITPESAADAAKRVAAQAAVEEPF